MAKPLDKIKLPKQAKENVELMFGELQKMQNNINLYIKGIIDANELDGDWLLEAATMELVKKEEPKGE